MRPGYADGIDYAFCRDLAAGFLCEDPSPVR